MNQPTTLEEILNFWTGFNGIPLFCFDNNLKIDFFHEDGSIFPKANICGLTLNFPTVHNEFDCFKNKMTYGIMREMVLGFLSLYNVHNAQLLIYEFL